MDSSHKNTKTCKSSLLEALQTFRGSFQTASKKKKKTTTRIWWQTNRPVTSILQPNQSCYYKKKNIMEEVEALWGYYEALALIHLLQRSTSLDAILLHLTICT